MNIELPMPQEAALLLFNTYYPGWHAIDQTGSEKEIFEIDERFLGIRLDGSETSITLKYQPFSFRLGAIVSIASVFLILMFGFVLGRKNKN